MSYQIGHQNYTQTGANRLNLANSYPEASNTLVLRGVPLKEAMRVLDKIDHGSMFEIAKNRDGVLIEVRPVQVL